MKTLTNGKVDGEALEDVLREMVDAEGVQDPGRDAEEEQQVPRILLLLASLPHKSTTVSSKNFFKGIVNLKGPGSLNCKKTVQRLGPKKGSVGFEGLHASKNSVSRLSFIVQFMCLYAP